MDWDESTSRIYPDNKLLNAIHLTKTINADGFNPFHQPVYLLLKLDPEQIAREIENFMPGQF
jgi:hypothetical protein